MSFSYKLIVLFIYSYEVRDLFLLQVLIIAELPQSATQSLYHVHHLFMHYDK